MRKLLLTALLATVAFPAFATPNWNIDPKTSRLSWTARFNMQSVSGQFDKWTGAILFDPDHLEASSIKISVDLTSVNSNDANRDSTLKGPDFFNIAGNPAATFTSTKISKTSQGYVAAGNLNLAGITKPLAVPFSVTINGGKAASSGVFKMSRSAFAIGKGQWNATQSIADLTVRNPPADPVNGIGDIVEVRFTLNADMGPPPAQPAAH